MATQCCSACWVRRKFVGAWRLVGAWGFYVLSIDATMVDGRWLVAAAACAGAVSAEFDLSLCSVERCAPALTGFTARSSLASSM